MELFLVCLAISYFFTKSHTAGKAYDAGHEPPGVAKARMRHEAGGGGFSPAGRRRGPGAFRHAVASRWANACRESAARGEHRAGRRRDWYAETAPKRDEKWREKKLRRLDKADAARRNWSERMGVIDLDGWRERRAAAKVAGDEEEAWREKEQREGAGSDRMAGEPAEASADTPLTDPADDAGSSAAPYGGDGVVPQDRPDEHPPSRVAGTATGGKQWAGETQPTPRPPVRPGPAKPAATTPPAGAVDVQGGVMAQYLRVVTILSDLASTCDGFAQQGVKLKQGLEGKGWGVEATSPLDGVGSNLTKASELYDTLAVEVRRQGDAASEALSNAPWVPDGRTLVQ